PATIVGAVASASTTLRWCRRSTSPSHQDVRRSAIRALETPFRATFLRMGEYRGSLALLKADRSSHSGDSSQMFFICIETNFPAPASKSVPYRGGSNARRVPAGYAALLDRAWDDNEARLPYRASCPLVPPPPYSAAIAMPSAARPSRRCWATGMRERTAAGRARSSLV